MADSRSPKGRNQQGGRRPGERAPKGRSQRPTDPASGPSAPSDGTEQLNLADDTIFSTPAVPGGRDADDAAEHTRPRGLPVADLAPANAEAERSTESPRQRVSGAAGIWAGARRAFSAQGSNARGTSSARLRTLLDERSREDRPRARFTARMAVLLVVLAILTVMFASSLRAYVQQRDHLQELKAGNETLRQQNAEMDDEITRWDDPAYVRTQARKQLGYLFPGEQGFKVVGLDGAVEDPALPEPQPTKVERTPWWSDAWASVELAGNPPKPQKKYDPNTTIDGDQPEIAEGTSKQ